MSNSDKLVKLIRRLVDRKINGFGVELGEMTSDSSLKVHDIEIKKSELLFLEPSTVNLATNTVIEGKVEEGGAGDSAHTHPFSYEDKSTYINKLKAGDKVALLRHRNTFICLGKVVKL